MRLALCGAALELRLLRYYAPHALKRSLGILLYRC